MLAVNNREVIASIRWEWKIETIKGSVVGTIVQTLPDCLAKIRQVATDEIA